MPFFLRKCLSALKDAFGLYEGTIIDPRFAVDCAIYHAENLLSRYDHVSSVLPIVPLPQSQLEFWPLKSQKVVEGPHAPDMPLMVAPNLPPCLIEQLGGRYLDLVGPPPSRPPSLMKHI